VQPIGVIVLSGDIKRVGNSTTKSGRVVSTFSVPCPKCKRERVIKRQQHAVSHINKLCRFCSSKDNHPQGEYNGVRVSWWNKYKLGASYRNIVWNLSLEDAVELLENQEWKCALTGLDLMCNGDLDPITASLDRIDNSKGYILGNIQFVHKEVNMMRGTLDLNRFTELCKLIGDRVKW
jgi:hypothetical protein